MESTDCKKAQREIRAIIRHEETRRSWRIANQSRGKQQLNGVSKVSVIKDGATTTLTEKNAIENAIMENNSKRFRLASSTPLIQPLAVHLLGYDGATEAAQSIIHSNYQPQTSFNKYVNIFMSYISKRPCLPTFSAQVSGQDFKDYWSGARESTASSMSGRHFGHYKAASKNTYLASYKAMPIRRPP